MAGPRATHLPGHQRWAGLSVAARIIPAVLGGGDFCQPRSRPTTGTARPQDRTRVSAQATPGAMRRARRAQAFKSSVRLFARNKMGVAGLAILAVFVVLALFADV